MRIGLGPVFACEWLITSRNWRVYALRLLFGLGLLTVLSCVALSNAESAQYRQVGTIRAQAEAGMAFASSIVATQLALILLIAPAMTAGSICLDKQRGTLAHVMVSDLSDAEIILGKLTARLLPAIGLVFSSLGITAICTLMGGIDPMGLLGAALVTLGVSLLSGSLALAFSVWAGKTHEVVMATYVVLILWVGHYPVWLMLSMVGGVTGPPEILQYANPFWLVADVRPGAVPLHRHGLFLLACLSASASLATMATLRVRAVTIRQRDRPTGRRKSRVRRAVTADVPVASEARPRRLFRLWPGPSLDGNPVLWRERHRRRPSRWSRAIWLVFAAGSITGTGLGIAMVQSARLGTGRAEVAMVLVNGFQVSLGLLLLSVSASTALAEERVRGSLDVLMTTPLSTRSLVWGKWWGTFRTVPFLAILPGVLAAAGAWEINKASPGLDFSLRWLGVSLVMGLTLAYGAALTSLGLALATWIPRLDRAVAATVGVYVFMALGWLFLIAILLNNDNVTGPGLSSASPFLGAAYTSLMIVDPSRGSTTSWSTQFTWAAFWISAYISAAAILMKMTILTFDRKLGRTPEGGMKPRRVPEAAKSVIPGKSSLLPSGVPIETSHAALEARI